jgi:hypothetical protein
MSKKRKKPWRDPLTIEHRAAAVPTPYAGMVRWLKRPTPAGVTLPPGMTEMVLQQWTSGAWVDAPIEWWGET